MRRSSGGGEKGNVRVFCKGSLSSKGFDKPIGSGMMATTAQSRNTGFSPFSGVVPTAKRLPDRRSHGGVGGGGASLPGEKLECDIFYRMSGATPTDSCKSAMAEANKLAGGYILSVVKSTSLKDVLAMGEFYNVRYGKDLYSSNRLAEEAVLEIKQRNAVAVMGVYETARRGMDAGKDLVKNYARCSEALKYLMVRACAGDMENVIGDDSSGVKMVMDCYARKALLELIEQDARGLQEGSKERARRVAYQAKMVMGYGGEHRPAAEYMAVGKNIDHDQEYAKLVLKEWCVLRDKTHLTEVETAVCKLSAQAVESNQSKGSIFGKKDKARMLVEEELTGALTQVLHYDSANSAADRSNNIGKIARGEVPYRLGSSQYLSSGKTSKMGNDVENYWKEGGIVYLSGYYSELAYQSGLAYTAPESWYGVPFLDMVRIQMNICPPVKTVSNSDALRDKCGILLRNPRYQLLMAEALLQGEGVLRGCQRDYVGGRGAGTLDLVDQDWLRAFEMNESGLLPDLAVGLCSDGVILPAAHKRDDAARILLRFASQDRNFGGSVIPAPYEAKALAASTDLSVGVVGSFGTRVWKSFGNSFNFRRNRKLQTGIPTSGTRKHVADGLLRGLRSHYGDGEFNYEEDKNVRRDVNTTKRNTSLKTLEEAARSGNVSAMIQLIELNMTGSKEKSLNLRRNLAKAVELIGEGIDQGMMYNSNFRGFMHQLAKKRERDLFYFSKSGYWYAPFSNLWDGITLRMRTLLNTDLGSHSDRCDVIFRMNRWRYNITYLLQGWKDLIFQAVDMRALRAFYGVDRHGNADIKSYMKSAKRKVYLAGGVWDVDVESREMSDFQSGSLLRENAYLEAKAQLAKVQDKIRLEYAFFGKGARISDNIANAIDSRIRTWEGTRRDDVSPDKYELYVELGKYMMLEWNQLSSGSGLKWEREAMELLERIDNGEVISEEDKLLWKTRKWGNMFKSLRGAHKEEALGSTDEDRQYAENIIVKRRKFKKYCFMDLVDWNGILQNVKRSKIKGEMTVFDSRMRVALGMVKDAANKGTISPQSSSQQSSPIHIEYHPEGCPVEYRSLVNDIEIPLSVVMELHSKLSNEDKKAGVSGASMCGCFVAYVKEDAPQGLRSMWIKKRKEKGFGGDTDIPPVVEEAFLVRQENDAYEKAPTSVRRKYFSQIAKAIFSGEVDLSRGQISSFLKCVSSDTKMFMALSKEARSGVCRCLEQLGCIGDTEGYDDDHDHKGTGVVSRVEAILEQKMVLGSEAFNRGLLNIFKEVSELFDYSLNVYLETEHADMQENLMSPSINVDNFGFNLNLDSGVNGVEIIDEQPVGKKFIKSIKSTSNFGLYFESMPNEFNTRDFESMPNEFNTRDFESMPNEFNTRDEHHELGVFDNFGDDVDTNVKKEVI